ncbi:arachidonate 5-lipoxygenase-activating protein isoform X3 [Phacochoerus africanus]|uniref:arachidonate 5-lipoxygenase-activating protein isoform X3 n=1 Tax=Phacochoerus africanus TaxID=41426 RepID=UPI001FDA931E|nr:arachidonate 5-lipoxygenase-activating protein isoform X3 [Phacochoerus africanus]
MTRMSTVFHAFFAHKVEHESKTHNGRSFQRTGTPAFERVYTANQNCVDAYPTFLVVLWSAGLFCSQVPAAFAGLMYLFVRQKYFVGYLGERTQRATPAACGSYAGLHHSLGNDKSELWPRRILSQLSEARDRSHILMDTSRVLNLLSHNGNA